MDRLSRRVDRLEGDRGGDPLTNSIHALVTLPDTSDLEGARRLAVEAGLSGPCVCLGEEGTELPANGSVLLLHASEHEAVYPCGRGFSGFLAAGDRRKEIQRSQETAR